MPCRGSHFDLDYCRFGQWGAVSDLIAQFWER